MQRGEIVKAGYLTKSPPDKPVAQWHKRWFVLLDSKLVYPLAPRCVRLVYYQSEMEAKKLGNPKGEIDLNKCREIANREAIKGHKYVFDVCTQDRIYHLAAECIEDKQQWIGTLNKVLHGGQVENGQRSHNEAHSRWSPPTDVPLRKRNPDDPLPRPLSYTGTGNQPFSSRPLPSLPPQSRPLPAPPSTSTRPSSTRPSSSQPLTVIHQYSAERRTSSPVVNTQDLPPPPPPPSTNRPPTKTSRAASVHGNIGDHYEMAPGQTPHVQPLTTRPTPHVQPLTTKPTPHVQPLTTRPTQRRKLTPQARSLDTFCFSLPASDGEYREFIDIPAEPPKSIRKQYESRRTKSGHSQADYVNLPDDLDDSKRDYVNLPDDLDDSKRDYVNLPDESDDSKREYINLADDPEDSKREYVNLEEPAVDGLDTDYSYLQQSHVPGYDPTNQDYSHLEIVPQHKRKGYEKPPRGPGQVQEGDYAHLKH